MIMIVHLRDITEKITKGTTPSNIGADFTEEGIMYFRSELIGRTKYVDKTKGLLFISSETNEKLKRSQIREGDLLFSMAGAYLGKISLVGEDDVPSNTNQAVAIIRFKKNICNIEYVYYYMKQPWFNEMVCSYSAQAAQPNINLEQIGNLNIQLAERTIQDKIVSILSAYDNLIENNTRRIRLLEQMAENLYKEWFVRFRFPGHENVEFENGLPKGWKVKRYSEEINIRYGKGLETSKLTKAGYPVFGSNGQIGFYTKYMYKEPQILISCRGASSGIVNISLPYSYVTSNSLVCELSEKTDCSFEYLKYYFKNTNLVQYQTGSAQPQITINNIEKLKLLVPSIDIQKQFSRVVKIIDAEILNIQHQVKNLTSQRDLLLPRLMSGKLEVKE
jgi:type I restriction enzyme S subunit